MGSAAPQCPSRSHIRTASSSSSPFSPAAYLRHRLSAVPDPPSAGNDRPLTCSWCTDTPHSNWWRLSHSQSSTSLLTPVATFLNREGCRTCQASERTSRSLGRLFARSTPVARYLCAVGSQSARSPLQNRCSHLQHYSSSS